MQERLDTLTEADQKAQSLTVTLSKKGEGTCHCSEKGHATETLIHARDLDYIGKRTFLGNYSLTEEEFSQLKNRLTTAI